MKHRLLILGTLGEFVQLVKKSKERGYYTIVCDGYPDETGKTVCRCILRDSCYGY